MINNRFNVVDLSEEEPSCRVDAKQLKKNTMTREEILSNFPDAVGIRFGTFFDLPTCLFDSNYFSIEIRTIDEGFLVNMDKFWSRDAVSEIVKSKEDAISFINGVFLNGL